MITTKKTECKVCKEEVPYTDMSNVPNTCWRKMCQVNFSHAAQRETITGEKPDPSKVGTWNPTSND